MRLTVAKVMASTLPQAVGLCANDLDRVCAYLNEAQQRLIPKGGDTGWVGTWQRTVFNVARTNPYITCPPEIARLTDIDICRMPIPVQNEWYEFLEDGVGLQKPSENCRCAGLIGAFDRGFFPSAFDLVGNMRIRVYRTTAEDDSKRVLIAGALDSNGNGIYTQDGINRANGFYLTLGSPFTESTYTVSAFSGLVKDITAGDVLVYGVDDNDEETFLTRMKPWETQPTYRRYYLQGLPKNCCDDAETAQVTAMCKLEIVPVTYPSDSLIIGCLPALISECQSIRFSNMDTAGAQVMSQAKTRDAVGYLNAELTHYLGRNKPAVNVAPFGSARLSRQAIGSLV